MARPGYPAEDRRREGLRNEEPLVEDEFACSGVLRESLLTLQPLVERIFTVVLTIGGEGETELPQNGQIWLRLKGRREDVEPAKLFVKGVVNQKQRQELQYPEDLHCVFCGARGLFMDCLIKNTSAYIMIGSVGFLQISGMEEPVVQAYSLVMDLVQRYKASKTKNEEFGLVGIDKSLDSRRAFKYLVESWEDQHTLNLLVLPVAVKEVLLDMVMQAGLDMNDIAKAGDLEGLRFEEPQSGLENIQLSNSKEQGASAVPQHSLTHHNDPMNLSAFHNIPAQPQVLHHFTYPLNQGINSNGDQTNGELVPSILSVRDQINIVEEGEQARERMKRQQDSPQDIEEEEKEEASLDEILLSMGSKQEFEHLLKFFTAMGFTEDVVQKVLSRTGPKEASQILDLVQQEQDKAGSQRNSWTQASHPGGVQTGLPAETSRFVPELPETVENGCGEHLREEDFVLRVLKQAAATCGYTEEKVMEVYSNLPELNPHELIQELQREQARLIEKSKPGGIKTETNIPAEGWSSVEANQEIKIEKQRGGKKKVDEKNKERGADKGGTSLSRTNMKQQSKGGRGAVFIGAGQQNMNKANSKPHHQELPHHGGPAPVRGPPQPTYPTRPYPAFPTTPPRSVKAKQVPAQAHSPPTTAEGAVVTGVQRFLEGLIMPFALKLTDDPGDPVLRQIIIDGSNVAMSHGLGQFFSCRGIALAVQYFWNRGHRKITAFVPQWRLKRDPKIKEQHFLTELLNLGLLSLTPSREVLGKRINSYDDRFMLQLAQQTDGVIVTNDNLRDLVAESHAWREIIKRRLLQYLFAGDLFMVPDDPLGRGGPHLNDFLHSHDSPPSVGNHTFAGIATPVTASRSPPPAQTEVLQFQERAAGGNRGLKAEMKRTEEETLHLRENLVQIFPDQEREVMAALQSNPMLRDINLLTNFILEQQSDGTY